MEEWLAHILVTSRLSQSAVLNWSLKVVMARIPLMALHTLAVVPFPLCSNSNGACRFHDSHGFRSEVLLLAIVVCGLSAGRVGFGCGYSAVRAAKKMRIVTWVRVMPSTKFRRSVGDASSL